MSALPESKLAREAEIAYQMICMSTDYDSWHDTEDVHVAMVMANMAANKENARHFIAAVLNELSKEEHAEQVLAKHLYGQTKLSISTAREGRSLETLYKLNWLFPGYFVDDSVIRAPDPYT
jgi:5'-methylthioadenosine phosphorylase